MISETLALEARQIFALAIGNWRTLSAPTIWAKFYCKNEALRNMPYAGTYTILHPKSGEIMVFEMLAKKEADRLTRIEQSNSNQRGSNYERG